MGKEIRTSATGEISAIVSGGQSIALFIIPRRAPEVPISLVAIFAAATLLKPFMLIASVVDDQVQDQFHAPLMTGVYKSLNVFDSTISWQYIFIIGHIIAHVMHRRIIHGR